MMLIYTTYTTSYIHMYINTSTHQHEHQHNSRSSPRSNSFILGLITWYQLGAHVDVPVQIPHPWCGVACSWDVPSKTTRSRVPIYDPDTLRQLLHRDARTRGSIPTVGAQSCRSFSRFVIVLFLFAFVFVLIWLLNICHQL
jgi:hypothetical protein